MRCALIAVLLVTSSLANAQTFRPCWPEGAPADSLRALARTLHPEAFGEDRRHSGVIVALAFDAQCQLTHHALGSRAVDQLNGGVDSTLRALLPTAGITRTRTGGIADAAGHVSMGPWIVWGVRNDTTSARRPNE